MLDIGEPKDRSHVRPVGAQDDVTAVDQGSVLEDVACGLAERDQGLHVCDIKQTVGRRLSVRGNGRVEGREEILVVGLKS